MERLDANRDGAVDRAEAAQHSRLAAMFGRLDVNRNGRLEPTEGPARHPRRHAGVMGAVRLEPDGDGRISTIEAAARPRLAAEFQDIDRNRDGYLVRSELQARAAQRRKQALAARQQRMQQKFAAADRNGDNRLSRAEVESVHPRLASRLAFMDEDRNGYLTLQDMQPEPSRQQASAAGPARRDSAAGFAGAREIRAGRS